MDFPVAHMVKKKKKKKSACNAGEVSPNPRSGISSGEGNVNPLLVENPMDRGTWRATVHGVPKNRT